MKKLLFAAILCSLWSCQDGGLTSPTVELGTTVSTNEPTSTQSEPVNEQSCFESLGIRRSGISYRVVNTTLYLYVPATNADYVNVWSPGVNDNLLGTGPVNQEFAVNLPGEGEFKITLAIERRLDTGVCQYDGHSFIVTSNTPPPPRTPDPDPDCEQVYIVDQQAYDEEIETCVPQEPIPGEDVIVGWVYKATGGSPETRESRCEDTFNVFSGPDGSYEASVEIPGSGVVDACVFPSDPGDDDFERGLTNPKTRFRLVGTRTVPGEPVPQPDICTVEVIHHDEVGHFEEICSE